MTGFDARILADSLGPNAVRLTTFVITYPRIVHAEFLTHRMLSRSAASSRAIPVAKQADRVSASIYVPDQFRANQKGMMPGEALPPDKNEEARKLWERGVKYNLRLAKKLSDLGVHKQWANRPPEFGSYITVIVTATEWNNFFKLRCHEAAQDELRKIATMMRDLLAANKPEPVPAGDWHLPFIAPDERSSFPTDLLLKFSVARCARVSYLNHFNTIDQAADIVRHDQLLRDQHFSPFEHQARATTEARFFANFRGWEQYRGIVVN